MRLTLASDRDSNDNKDFLYRNYHGSIQYHQSTDTFYGHIVELMNNIDLLKMARYEGKTAQECLDNFQKKVDAYYKYCEDTLSDPDFGNVRFVKTKTFLSSCMELTEIRERIREKMLNSFQSFLNAPSTVDNDNTDWHGYYNVFRAIQHIQTKLMNHYSRYAILLGNQPACIIPDEIPDTSFNSDISLDTTVDFGDHKDTMTLDVSFLPQFFSELNAEEVRSIEIGSGFYVSYPDVP